MMPTKFLFFGVCKLNAYKHILNELACDEIDLRRILSLAIEKLKCDYVNW
jgi:hypothetical protein